MRSGETLFREGDDAHDVLILLSGIVKIWIEAPSGRQVILDVLDVGSMLGELSSIDGAPRSGQRGRPRERRAPSRSQWRGSTAWSRTIPASGSSCCTLSRSVSVPPPASTRIQCQRLSGPALRSHFGCCGALWHFRGRRTRGTRAHGPERPRLLERSLTRSHRERSEGSAKPRLGGRRWPPLESRGRKGASRTGPELRQRRPQRPSRRYDWRGGREGGSQLRLSRLVSDIRDKMDRPILEDGERLVLSPRTRLCRRGEKIHLKIGRGPRDEGSSSPVGFRAHHECRPARGGGQPRYRVRLDGVVRVEVTDESELLPERVLPSEARTGGRGLLLVDAFASDWGVESQVRGKTVWFELAYRKS